MIYLPLILIARLRTNYLAHFWYHSTPSLNVNSLSMTTLSLSFLSSKSISERVCLRCCHRHRGTGSCCNHQKLKSTWRSWNLFIFDKIATISERMFTGAGLVFQPKSPWCLVL